MARSIPGFGEEVRFSNKILPAFLQGLRGKRVAKTAEVVVPKAVRHEVRDMEEFEAKEEMILARLKAELGGQTPVLDYSAPHQQHYVVLVENGRENRSRVLSQTTIAYGYAKDSGAPGTLGK
ncbi:hypothetical protein K2P56_01010 [Patescibacteria group bacterium]|nr:hypothetical protein [Patescibacteria group bacterium]